MRIGKADSTDYDFALFQVGIDAGIFKKLDLELTTVTLPGAQLHQAMTANSGDIALGSGTDFQFVANGAPERGVAAFAGAPISLEVLVRADGSVKKVTDITGRDVGVSTAGSLTYWLTTELSRRLGWSGAERGPARDTPDYFVAARSTLICVKPQMSPQVHSKP